jgi:septum formation inhibitor MinC
VRHSGLRLLLLEVGSAELEQALQLVSTAGRELLGHLQQQQEQGTEVQDRKGEQEEDEGASGDSEGDSDVDLEFELEDEVEQYRKKSVKSGRNTVMLKRKFKLF